MWPENWDPKKVITFVQAFLDAILIQVCLAMRCYPPMKVDAAVVDNRCYRWPLEFHEIFL